MKSKGAILVKQKKLLVIDDFLFPKKLFKGQVLIEFIYSGVCGSQIGEIDGVKGKDIYLPHLLGHEGVGHVIKKHRSVTKVKNGDKVMLHWMPTKGINANTPIYTWKNKILNGGRVTTFNNHSIVSENRLTKLDDKINDLDAVLLGCSASTALGSVIKLVKIKKNQTVAVAGCGILGLYIISILNYLKIKNIIAIDILDKKLNLAKKRGAKYFINSRNRKIDREILRKFKSGVDYFFECSGNTEIINRGFKSLNQRGTEIFIGVPKFKKKAEFSTLDINLGKKIIGSKGGNFIPHEDMQNFYNIVRKSGLNHKTFISEKIKLGNLNELINEMRLGNVDGKPIIVF